MSVETILRSAAGAKSGSTVQVARPRHRILHLRLPPIPFNRFDEWPSVVVVSTGASGTVVRLALDHPTSLIALDALLHVGAQRIKPFA